MDFIKKNLSHGGSSQPQVGQGRPADSGGLGGNVNNALGGGQAGEKNEGISKSPSCSEYAVLMRLSP